MERSQLAGSQRGFSLLEAIVAVGLLAGGLAALGQMFGIAVATNSSSRTGTVTRILAEQKVEQLRGLTWALDTQGLPMSDTTSDTARADPTPSGGTGLTPSPAGSLQENRSGYVDYLDQHCRILGGGTTAPEGAVYTRRWSIEPLPTDPIDTLVIRVIVTGHREREFRDKRGGARRFQDDAQVMTIKTRKAR